MCDKITWLSDLLEVFELEKLRSSSSNVKIEMRKTSSRHDDELRSPAIDESRTRRSRDIDESRTRRSRDIDESKSHPIDESRLRDIDDCPPPPSVAEKENEKRRRSRSSKYDNRRPYQSLENSTSCSPVDRI